MNGTFGYRGVINTTEVDTGDMVLSNFPAALCLVGSEAQQLIPIYPQNGVALANGSLFIDAEYVKHLFGVAPGQTNLTYNSTYGTYDFAASPTFSSLTLSSPLPVASGGTNVTVFRYEEGSASLAVGTGSLLTLSSGNTAVGKNAMNGNVSGTGSVALGADALRIGADGADNTVIGTSAFHSHTTGGFNTLLGSNTGFSNVNGTGNVFLGFRAGYYETGSDKLYIANSLTTTPLIYGDFYTAECTINGRLTVRGQIDLGSSVNQAHIYANTLGLYVNSTPVLDIPTSSYCSIQTYMDIANMSGTSEITNYYGMHAGVASGGASARVLNAYAGYFITPAIGSVKNIALHASDLSVGTTTTPPDNGILCEGDVKFNSNLSASHLTVGALTAPPTNGMRCEGDVILNGNMTMLRNDVTFGCHGESYLRGLVGLGIAGVNSSCLVHISATNAFISGSTQRSLWVQSNPTYTGVISSYSSIETDMMVQHLSGAGAITDYHGIHAGTTVAVSARVTNAYGGYFITPTVGTVKNMALYAADLSVGTTLAPPASGILCEGDMNVNGVVSANGQLSVSGQMSAHGQVFVDACPTIAPSGTLSLYGQINVNMNSANIGTGGVLEYYYGILGESGASSTVKVTNAFNGYFEKPTIASVKNVALYAADLSVGTLTAPPANGILCEGDMKVNGNLTMSSLTLGSLTLSTPLEVNSGGTGLTGTSFRYYAEYYNLGVGIYTLDTFGLGMGNFNVAVGPYALRTLPSGDGNVALGAYAGHNTVGEFSVFLGHRAGYYETGSNKLYIANDDTTTPLIYGDFAAAQVTINGSMVVTGTVSMNNASQKIRISDGTEALPAYSFAGDSGSTGLWWSSPGKLNFSVSGTNRGYFDSSGLTLSGLTAAAGLVSQTAGKLLQSTTVTSPLTFSGSTLSISANPSFTTVTAGTGSEAAPSYSFTGYTNTGIYTNTLASRNVSFTIDGYRVGYFYNGGLALDATLTLTTPYMIADNIGCSTEIVIDYLQNNQPVFTDVASKKLVSVAAIPVTNGGTGFASYAIGDILYANGTTTLAKCVAAATGNVLLSGTAPSWGKVALTTHVSGILPVANGGTNTNTFRYLESATSLAIGTGALISGIATNNTAIGINALRSNTSGTSNVAVGTNALYTNTTQPELTAIGYEALYSYNSSGNGRNTAIGYYALRANTSGTENTALGHNALKTNTTAPHNTALGNQAMVVNLTGRDNAAVGSNAMYSNTSGSYNAAFGGAALFSNQSGANNTALGFAAGQSCVSGGSNVFLGYQAGYSETTSNKLYISNTSTSSPLIYGEFNTGKMRINTMLGVGMAPTNALDVSGSGTVSTKLTVGTSTLGSNALDVTGLATFSTGIRVGGGSNTLAVYKEGTGATVTASYSGTSATLTYDYVINGKMACISFRQFLKNFTSSTLITFNMGTDFRPITSVAMLSVPTVYYSGATLQSVGQFQIAPSGNVTIGYNSANAAFPTSSGFNIGFDNITVTYPIL